MVFSSQVFLFIFLPITFITYQLVKNVKFKNIILIIASLLFYAYDEPFALLIMLASIFLNNLFVHLLIKRRNEKAVLFAAVIYNIGILFVFKYLSWIVNGISGKQTLNIVLPIGISFFTFQMMSYVIDVYRDKSITSHSLINTMLYCSFFPQLIAGPIVKYHDIEKQLDNRSSSPDLIISGIKRFIIGLFKKIVISDTLAVIADTAFNTDNKYNLSALTVLICAICYTFQIYFDFSGYSDMAIGLGKMFGFQFLENFNYPYISSSMRDFWHRWHISLSTWFKEYVYIPLGGNRKGKARTSINKLFVFILTGIWHGANFTFLLWGIIHGTFLFLEETSFGRFIKKHKILGHVYTMAVVVLSFVIFRADNISDAFVIISRLFVGYGVNYSASTAEIISAMSPYVITTIILALIMSTPLIKNAALKIKKSKVGLYNAVSAILLAIMLIYSMAVTMTGNYSPFIYFQF